jgi:protein SDA1
LPSLLKTLFPILPRTTSSSLRAIIRRTILSDIKTANQRTKNHKLNRAVQAMLFGMVERGMGGAVQGDKGKLRSNPNTSAEGLSSSGGEAMWAVVLTKELWTKGIWYVSVVPHQTAAIDKSVGTMPSLSP